jgi:hypothetical protein
VIAPRTDSACCARAGPPTATSSSALHSLCELALGIGAAAFRSCLSRAKRSEGCVLCLGFSGRLLDLGGGITACNSSAFGSAATPVSFKRLSGSGSGLASPLWSRRFCSASSGLLAGPRVRSQSPAHCNQIIVAVQRQQSGWRHGTTASIKHMVQRALPDNRCGHRSRSLLSLQVTKATCRYPALRKSFIRLINSP